MRRGLGINRNNTFLYKSEEKSNTKQIFACKQTEKSHQTENLKSMGSDEKNVAELKKRITKIAVTEEIFEPISNIQISTIRNKDQNLSSELLYLSSYNLRM